MVTFVLTVIVVLAAALTWSTVIYEQQNPASTSTAVVAMAVEPNGTLVTHANLTLGQELLLSVTVPSSSDPVSLHQIFNGHDYGELAWNVTSTHYTYVIDSGPADSTDVGLDKMYAVVTFADGGTARSNNVTMDVTS